MHQVTGPNTTPTEGRLAPPLLGSFHLLQSEDLTEVLRPGSGGDPTPTAWSLAAMLSSGAKQIRGHEGSLAMETTSSLGSPKRRILPFVLHCHISVG